MKTRKIFLTILFVVFLCLLWVCIRWHEEKIAIEPISIDATNVAVEAQPKPVGQPPLFNVTTNPLAHVHTNKSADPIEQRRQQIETEQQRGLEEWKTPIQFYGKVVDENTNPVANASIHFVWTDISPQGNSETNTTSDQNGLFNLENTSGKNLMVQVSKEGYYAYQRFGMAFNYAGENQNFTPDAANPVIFRLKKKGIPEPLTSFDKNFQISISGKPLEIDLRTGATTPPGQGSIVMEYLKASPQNPDGHIYDWSFQIAVQNGGLILSTNELDFVAPLNGYQSSDLVEMKSSPEENWQSRMNRQYFVKTSDGTYSRVVIDLMSHNGSLKVQAFTNPSGSRNLEYDSAVR